MSGFIHTKDVTFHVTPVIDDVGAESQSLLYMSSGAFSGSAGLSIDDLILLRSEIDNAIAALSDLGVVAKEVTTS